MVPLTARLPARESSSLSRSRPPSILGFLRYGPSDAGAKTEKKVQKKPNAATRRRTAGQVFVWVARRRHAIESRAGQTASRAHTNMAKGFRGARGSRLDGRLTRRPKHTHVRLGNREE
eukprot:4437293-Prymnesium_polylepis.1